MPQVFANLPEVFMQNSPCQIIKTSTGKNYPLMDGDMKNSLVLDMAFLPDQICEPSQKNSAYLLSTATKHTAANNLKLPEGWTSSTKAVPLVFLLFRGHERFAKTRGVGMTGSLCAEKTADGGKCSGYFWQGF